MDENLVCVLGPDGEALAARLGLPYEGEEAARAYAFQLAYREDRLCLTRNVPRAPAPTCVDFADPALDWRRATSGQAQGVALAVGVKKLGRPALLDATAGLGRDAFVLAALGCQVTLLERSPLVHALLEDGLRRAREAGGELGEIVERMVLYSVEARDWLAEVAQGRRARPDVVYLDPMFPTRGKSAQVKKDMALLHALLGIEEDFDSMLRLARRAALHRIVVKRPGPRTSGGEEAPNFQVPGRASHFDVYLPLQERREDLPGPS